MDKREYLRVVQVGNVWELMKALQWYTDFPLWFEHVDAKTDAILATKPSTRQNKKPKFRFGPLFFTKLNMFPAVSVEVNESRNQLRKTCYGFRERTTNERVYLRIDPGSVLEVRDGTCGYLIGTRYLIPGIDRMKSPRWDKLNRLLTRLLSANGIIVKLPAVRKYQRTLKPRVMLTKRLMSIRFKYVKGGHRKKERRQREEARKQVPRRSRVVRNPHSARSAGS